MLEIQRLTVPTKLVNALHKQGSILRAEALGDATDEGNFYLLVAEDNPKSSALAVASGDKLLRVTDKDKEYQGIRPRDKAQVCFIHALETRALTVGLGAAGTGKTTLALAYALQKLFREDKQIILTKPSAFVGKSNAVAAIPGDIREKISPYIESYISPLRKILGDYAEQHIYEFEERKLLTFQPLELVRGLNFDNATVILDEAQNTSPHELMSFISRVGEGSTCIILGDPAQIDTELTWEETGLYALASSEIFYTEGIAVGIHLVEQYRSRLANLAAEALKEWRETVC
jgi:PhoH-like ATPase